MLPNNDIEYDIIVVGSGLSGLTTAFHLAERDPNLNVAIFEKRREVGGLLITTNIGELGAKFITKDHLEAWDLTEKLGVEFILKKRNEHWSDFNEWKRSWKSEISKFEIMRFIHEMDVECQSYNPKW